MESLEDLWAQDTPIKALVLIKHLSQNTDSEPSARVNARN